MSNPRLRDNRCFLGRNMAGTDPMMSSSRKPTGMKGKVHDLAATLQTQNEELAIEKGHVSTIRNGGSGPTSALHSQVADIQRFFQADVQRMYEDFKVHQKVQESENVRLQQQVTQLKGEKTSIHQQIVALQRRIEEIEEEMGGV